jgi:transcriptional regulator with XRE-family HTH domain
MAVSKPRKEPPSDTTGDELAATVGENLRRHRVRRGLSMEKLAQLSGVSRSMLGQIELGQSTPTIKTLWRIAVALKLPFASLMAQSGRVGTRLVPFAASRTLTSQDGSFTSRALFPFDGERKVEFYELRLAARSAEHADAHAPGTVENLVVTARGARADGRRGSTSAVEGRCDRLRGRRASRLRESRRNAGGDVSGDDLRRGGRMIPFARAMCCRGSAGTGPPIASL